MLGGRVILRSIRRLYYASTQDPVEEDLRGWNWDRPPLKPRAYLGLTVSEVSSKYCPTRRDIWLRRVCGFKCSPSRQMVNGRIVHEIFHEAMWGAFRLLTNGFPGWMVYEKLSRSAWGRIREITGGHVEKWMVDLYKTLLVTIVSEAEESRALCGGFPGAGILPWPTELRVDGSPLSLSNSLRVDALAEGGIIVEVKHGKPMDFHMLSLAGYSLALEASLEVPFNYGIIVYVNGVPDKRPNISFKPVYISNSLRRWFIDERDEIIDFLLSEEEPPKCASIDKNCPYRGVC